MSKPNTRGACPNPEKQLEEVTEQLIKKVCSKFSEQLEAKFIVKFNELSKKLDDSLKVFHKVSETVVANQKAIANIESRCMQFDHQLRRNSLLLKGLNETDGEDTLEVILSIISSRIKVLCTVADLDSAYRIGRATSENKSRPIRINFLSNIKRNEVFKARKLLKGTGITIQDDLTKEQLNLFTAAKQKYGNRNVWTLGGKICTIKNDVKCIVNSLEDL